MRLRSNAAIFLFLVGAVAGAQQASASQWPRVRVNVSVMDQNDAPAAGVTADALEITDGSAPAKDAVLRPVGDAPESVCLLVDMSGSTYQARDTIHAGLLELIRKLPAQDEACLIDFSSVAFVDVPLTMDRAKLMDGLKYLKSSGGSALLDAVEATAEYLQNDAHNQRRVLVLVSDGGENASKTNQNMVRRRLQQPGGVVMYWLAVDLSGHRDETRLRALTEGTGGLEFPVKGQKDAVGAVDSLVQAMQGRYELEFTASDPAADDSERKLRIALKKEWRKQKMEAVGPDGYVAAQQ